MLPTAQLRYEKSRFGANCNPLQALGLCCPEQQSWEKKFSLGANNVRVRSFVPKRRANTNIVAKCYIEASWRLMVSVLSRLAELRRSIVLPFGLCGRRDATCRSIAPFGSNIP